MCVLWKQFLSSEEFYYLSLICYSERTHVHFSVTPLGDNSTTHRKGQRMFNTHTHTHKYTHTDRYREGVRKDRKREFVFVWGSIYINMRVYREAFFTKRELEILRQGIVKFLRGRVI